MSFAKENGIDVYRLVAHLDSGKYSVENGTKTPLTLSPLDTMDEAIDFIYKHNVARGSVSCRYVLVESKE